MTPLEWGALAAVVGAAIALLWGWSSAVFIVVVPTELTMTLGETKSVQAKLYYKPWFTKKVKATQGKVNARALSPSIAAVSPSSSPVGHQDAAEFTVSGGSVGGPAIVKLSGTSRHGEHEAVDVSVTVVAPVEENDDE